MMGASVSLFSLINTKDKYSLYETSLNVRHQIMMSSREGLLVFILNTRREPRHSTGGLLVYIQRFISLRLPTESMT
jgi:hypothetical protein